MERTQRLCNEIQLFDLCDLDNCSHKSGRFCGNAKLVSRFEAIQDQEAALEIDAEAAYSEEDTGFGVHDFDDEG